MASGNPSGEFAISTGTARLVRDGDLVTLEVNGVPSSTLGSVYFEYMLHVLAVLTCAFDRPVRALHLGAAGCTLATEIERRWPGSRQVAVEVDAELARRARTDFGAPRSPALRIRVGDARAEMAAMTPGRFDVVIRDAFDAAEVPPHLRTMEFTRDVARVLAPGGIYLANTEDRPPLARIRHEVAAVAAVFTHTGLIAEPAQFRLRRRGNFVMAGSSQPLPADLERSLRTLAMPAVVVTGSALTRFVAGARPFEDG